MVNTAAKGASRKRVIGTAIRLPDLLLLFLRRHAEPATLILMNLNIVKTRLLQKGFQLHVPIDGHAADFLRPFVILVRIPAALVAQEKGSLQL